MDTMTTIFLYVILRGSVEDKQNRYPMPNLVVCQEAIKTSRHNLSPQQIRESGIVMFCAGDSEWRYGGEWIKDKKAP